MYRFVASSLSLFFLALAVGLTAPAAPVRACTLAPLTDRHFPGLYEDSSVVAIGHFVDATEDEITLVVEEGLAGATAGQRITLSNRFVSIGADCSVEPSGRGFAYPEGETVLVFLEPVTPDGDLLWPASFGRAVFLIDDGRLYEVTSSSGGGSDLSLRAAIEAAPAGDGPGGRDFTGVGSVVTLVVLAGVAVIFWRRR